MQKTTIVFPCYNEEKRINQAAFISFVQKNDIRLLFVDDGSKDRSLSILQALRSEKPNHIFIHRLKAKSGKAEAVRQGLLQALALGSPIVGYADIDLATPLDELVRLAELLSESEAKILLGSRVKLLGRRIQRKKLRHYLGRFFATLASLILKLEVYDTQCGAKFFKCHRELELALNHEFVTQWVFDLELIKRLLNNDNIAVSDFIEEPLKSWSDIDGSKLSTFAIFKAMYDLLKVWRLP